MLDHVLNLRTVNFNLRLIFVMSRTNLYFTAVCQGFFHIKVDAATCTKMSQENDQNWAVCKDISWSIYWS